MFKRLHMWLPTVRCVVPWLVVPFLTGVEVVPSPRSASVCPSSGLLAARGRGQFLAQDASAYVGPFSGPNIGTPIFELTVGSLLGVPVLGPENGPTPGDRTRSKTRPPLEPVSGHAWEDCLTQAATLGAAFVAFPPAGRCGAGDAFAPQVPDAGRGWRVHFRVAPYMSSPPLAPAPWPRRGRSLESLLRCFRPRRQPPPPWAPCAGGSRNHAIVTASEEASFFADAGFH